MDFWEAQSTQSLVASFVHLDSRVSCAFHPLLNTHIPVEGEPEWNPWNRNHHQCGLLVIFILQIKGTSHTKCQILILLKYMAKLHIFDFSISQMLCNDDGSLSPFTNRETEAEWGSYLPKVTQEVSGQTGIGPRSPKSQTGALSTRAGQRFSDRTVSPLPPCRKCRFHKI